ncbi:MAG: ABC transporter ATP-binding protein [Desulfobacterales bacterium]|nr:ABC transporter ATP-binding protein [Desulfobacterales bacterium]
MNDLVKNKEKDKLAKDDRLEVNNMELRFGGVTALSRLSYDIGQSQITAIIGPNGAGKTSNLNCINGFYQPQRGEISFNDKKINGLPPYKIAQLGISRTFQNMQLYTGLSTVDNLMAARHIHLRPKLLASCLYYGWGRNKEIKHREIVEEIIDFLEMEPIRHKIVGSLPYGERKRVDLGRALALEPRLLLLDEPMAGMNVEEKEDMARFIIDINELRKIPIVLVEHDMGVVMDICDKVIVLDFGVKVAEGSPEEIKTNPDVIRVYLGDEG